MIISKEKVVSVNYYLTANKDNLPEELIEETSHEHPFIFLFGSDGVLPDFESNLNGKQKGDKFDFRITAEKGYGLYDKEYLVNIDKAAFELDGKFDESRVIVGHDIEMRDNDGNPLIGRVLTISDKIVEMDFNHPLAGHDLHFIGEILNVRNATNEELSHGHVHGPGGHHHH
jgi:FKBP-type peptidyl-prolyl cis-trans isomerase SlyD